jgi:cyclohexanone monooxygenase
MRDNNYSTINATREAEEEWRKHTNEVADKSLFPLANSWYFGKQTIGKMVTRTT